MKLIEKKCPNCGAELKFEKDETEVKCNYCNTSYIIQRDADLNSLTNNAFDSDDYILHRKMVNNASKVVFVLSTIIIIFTMIVFLIIFFRMMG